MAVTIERERIHIKKGDTVEVMGGRQRGKRGKVLKVLPKHGRVIIEGVNVVKRHTKPTQKMPQGGIVEKEAPVYGSRVMMACPKCSRAARVGHGYLADGTKVRVCKRCGEQIEKRRKHSNAETRKRGKGSVQKRHGASLRRGKAI